MDWTMIDALVGVVEVLLLGWLWFKVDWLQAVMANVTALVFTGKPNEDQDDRDD